MSVHYMFEVTDAALEQLGLSNAKENVDREILQAKKSLLVGPIVPDAYKPLSDGCSVPLPKRFAPIYEHNAEAACMIHDWEYFLCRILWDRYLKAKMMGKEALARYFKMLWRAKRWQADANFRQNIWLLWKTSGEPLSGLFGMTMSVGYWRAVRLFGRDAAKRPLPTVITNLDFVEDVRRRDDAV